LNPATIGNIETLLRDVNQTPGSVFEKMQLDIQVLERRSQDFRMLVKQLVGYRSFTKTQLFPPTPNTSNLDQNWYEARGAITRAVRWKITEPSLKPTDAGYLAARINDLLEGRIPHDKVDEWVEDSLAGLLGSPQAVLALVRAVFLNDLLNGSEPLCEGEYSRLLKKEYEEIRVTGMYLGR
jgi:hypothetical protein